MGYEEGKEIGRKFQRKKCSLFFTLVREAANTKMRLSLLSFSLFPLLAFFSVLFNDII